MLNILYICPDSTMGGSTHSLLSMIESTRDSVKPVVLFMYDGIACKVFRDRGVECLVYPYIKLHLFPQKYTLLQRLRHPSHFRIVRLHRVERACVRHVREYLGNRHIDIVHSNYSSILIGWRLARALRARHVWHIREYLDPGIHVQNRPYGGRWLLKALINRADARIVISHQVLEHWGFKEKNTWVIPPAVAKAADTCYYPEKEPYFLFCSYFVTKAKGAMTAIDAFGKSGLWKEGVRLLYVGNCFEETAAEIRDIAKAYGCEDAVVFSHSQEDVKPFFSHAKAFIMASTHEGLGRVTAEAMFYGCPVIAKDSGGTVDLVKDGVTGYLFQTSDECAALLRQVFHTTPESIIRHAQRFVVDNMSVEAYGPRIMEVYRAVL